MTRLPRPQIVRITCLACAFGLLGLFASALTSQAAEKKAASDKKTKGQITKLTVDPAAEQVELFEGIEKGQVEVKIIAKDPFQGNMLFENKTDKPITVKVPDAIVGVPVLKQFGGPNGGGGTGLGGIGGSQNSGQNQQPQPFGGGFGGGGGLGGIGGGGGFGGGGYGGGLGGGFFSIPPEKIVRVPYNSVCLAHGRPEPRPGVNYKLSKVEDYTKDTTLQEVVRMVGTGRLDRQSAQAAAWHLTDNMSWQELANKKLEFLGGQGAQPYFAPNQLFQAQSIVSQATASAKERQEKKPEQGTPVPATVRTLKTR